MQDRKNALQRIKPALQKVKFALQRVKFKKQWVCAILRPLVNNKPDFNPG